MDKHYVEVVRISDGKVEKRLGPRSARVADKIERGILMQINAEEYFTRQVLADDKEDE